MNKHERVTAALSGKEVDHVPAAFWLHFPPEQAAGQPAVDAHLDFYRETDVDILKVMNEHTYRSEIKVNTPADWAAWTPLSARSAHFQKQVDLVKAVADRLAGEVPIIATIHGTFISLFHGSKEPHETIFGHNLATEHIRATPEAVAPALSAVADSLIELSLACLEAGASGIYYGAQGGEEHRFTSQTFNNWIKPYDLKVLEEVAKKTDQLFVHICKDTIRLPLYADYPGQAFNWAVHDSAYSLTDGREIFKRTMLGGLDDRSGVMVEGTDQEIAAAVETIVSDYGRTFLIIGADCTLPTDIPLHRIRAAVEAARSL